jgi:hypothetical protein
MIASIFSPRIYLPGYEIADTAIPCVAITVLLYLQALSTPGNDAIVAALTV